MSLSRAKKAEIIDRILEYTGATPNAATEVSSNGNGHSAADTQVVEAPREDEAVASAPRVDAAVVVDEYGGQAERIWTDAADGNDLRKRISSLPGFGDMKLKSLSAVLAKRFGVEAAQEIAPNHPTLGDVDSPEALEEYQAKKRAHKAEMRAKQQS